MRLSQIKLAGFKSFVDPTQIHLPGQIVGVVGPNGCGKSNVIDALRWVLGESKASALRGESMQDVIFNGSVKRKPVARASVELVFDNQLGKAVGQWSSYAEIAIKRVLQRNGESSYHINNQKVRRRDITDIFLGTGLGARAYAIVEQGMISRIIEAKPEELRVFLEEAAGVSRYRDRRRETAQRLADTRNNLLRISDILLEMDKQLSHLCGQAEKASQYRELESLRDTTQKLHSLFKKQESAGLRAAYAGELEKTRTLLEAKTAGLRAIESQLEIERSRHYQFTDQLSSRQGEFYGANTEVARFEQQIEHATLQQQRLTQQFANVERQIVQLQQQHQSALCQLEHWQRQQEEAAIRLCEAEQNVQLESEVLPQAEIAARNAQHEHNELQREQLKMQQQIQLAQTQLDNLRRNITQLELRRSRLLLEHANLPRPDGELLQQTQEEWDELQMSHQVLEETLATLQLALPQSDSQRLQLRSELQQQERQSVKIEARLHALQQLQQVDNDKKLKHWLQQYNLDGLPRLWQSIRIERGWENALEAVLRERLNALALPKLERVAGWDAAPARFAVFETITAQQLTPENPGVLRPLLSYIHCQDEAVLSAVREWLGGVYAATDIDQALQMRTHLPEGGCLVTHQGHLLGRHSILYHAADSQFHGVLNRQNEIEQLDDELAIITASVEQLKLQLAMAEQQHHSIEAQIAPLRNAIPASQQRQHVLQLQILKLNQAQQRSSERAMQIDNEISELATLLKVEQEQQIEISEELGNAVQRLGIFHSQVTEAQNSADLQEVILRERRSRVQQVQHALQEANFYSRTCMDKIAGLQDGIHQIIDTRMRHEHEADELRAELSTNLSEIPAQLLQDALLARHQAEQKLAEARHSLENATLQLQSLEQARLSCEQELYLLSAKVNDLALKEQEARLYVEQWDAQLQGVDEKSLLPLLDKVKPAQLQSELNRLSRSIEALGAVNLAALEELQAAQERKSYLDAQSLDLQQAMATLEEAIRHIDRESRDLLMATYNQVNLQLSELFPVLFAGGEARLVLTGEEILDSGVQVMAQPPGKKNSTIHLLSGGEKALTAIALIFSLFQLNPAPFCLLDEVDAPLDDTNTERLCALVRKMAQHTQFIFISHNKIAMEMAEQLIGVTMQEKGVSKIVSVDIEAALRLRDS